MTQIAGHFGNSSAPNVIRLSYGDPLPMSVGAVQESHSKWSARTCVSAHLSPDGSGEVQVFGNPPEVFIPTMILNGENIAIFVPRGT